MAHKIEKVQKREGTVVDFNAEKITTAIEKAINATGHEDGVISKKASDRVVDILSRRFKKGEIPHIEQIQDVIEEVLMEEDMPEVAKAYILYREQRRKLREVGTVTETAVDHIDEYLNKLDWEVRENANMAYSLQGLNHYVATHVMKKYWMEKIYPKEIRDANETGDFHVHNLDTLGPYCMGWDLYDFLLKGFGGVHGKVESKPPKHLRTALGQIVNFLYTMQGECAGAVAFSNFDTLLAPFIRYDNLNYQQVKQSLQEFLFNMAVPTRVGFQTPFSNITLDIRPSAAFANEPVIIGGELKPEKYGDFAEEMKVLDKALYECMLEGDRSGRPFTFPIPTINITKDFDWDTPDLDLMWEATAKYGINYFANYINSEMSPSDVRSMCCRLRLDLKELRNRGGGGLFGAGALTGSVGVVTLNLPRIGYTSKTKKEFFAQLEKKMDLAKESLEIKRKILEDFISKGLYPYSRYYLDGVKKGKGKYFANHFSTIGISGMNEALINFLGEDMGTAKGRKFALEVLDAMRDKLLVYQKETGNIYNLEATPAESTAYRLALRDKKRFADITTAGTEEVPYYTNSTLLPVNYTDDVFEVLNLQDEIQCKYTGGTVLHIFVGEKISDIASIKSLVKKVFSKFSLPYITISPTFSICPTHGYIAGEHNTCPHCVVKQPCEVYSRIVGYLRPVSQWNSGKQQEFKDRKTFAVDHPVQATLASTKK